MTATDYQNNGYKVSLQLSQNIINKAETTAMSAYVLPILPTATTQDTDVKSAVMALAYLIMCRDNVFVTRSGARSKNSPNNSEKVEAQLVTNENVAECARLLDIVRLKDGALRNPQIVDVAKIFFKTNYFYF